MSFLITALILLLFIYLYVGIRVIPASRLGRKVRVLLWGFLVVCMVSVPAAVAARYLFPTHWISTPLAWFAYGGFGFFTLILPVLILRDSAWGLRGLIKKFQAKSEKTTGQAADPGRRLFLLNTTNAAVLGAGGVLTGYGVAQAVQTPGVVQVDVPLPKLPATFHGFKILQITDLHVSLTVKADYVRRVVERSNAQNPDLVVFTGDMADGPARELGKEAHPLARLQAPFGKYFVTGNHEYYSGVEGWLSLARDIGFTPLLNEHASLEQAGENIILAGITDFRAHTIVPDHLSDPDKALKGSSPDQLRIMLAHQPKSIYQVAPHDVDLMISGHTHGGQYLPWNFMVPLDQPYVHGLHRHENTQIYVSRGTGYWGPPLRIGAPSEITVLRLVQA